MASTQANREIRDACGDCGKVLIVTGMKTFEGDRYCAACHAEIITGAADFYSNHPDISVIDRITSLAGKRIRVTWPNGHQQSGDISIRAGSANGLRDGFEPTRYAVMSGHGLVGGEFCPAVKIETMGSNGRYSPVWAA